jgi:hypothetical protein
MSAKRFKADIDQVAATNRGFMSTRPNLRLMTAEHVQPVWDGGRTVAGNVDADLIHETRE